MLHRSPTEPAHRPERRLRRPGPGPTGGHRPALRALLWRRTALRRASAALAAGAAVVAAGRWDGPDRPADHPASGPLAPVAAADLQPGDRLGPDDIDWMPLPTAIARYEGDPTGAVAITTIGPGEVIGPGRVAAVGRSGLRTDERAVAVLPPTAALPLTPGDVVELVAVRAAPGVGGAGSIDGGITTTRFEATGRVLAVDDDAVTVALPADLAAEVVGHQAVGSIELLLTPWSP